MRHSIVRVAIALAAIGASQPRAQTTNAALRSFEVASIKLDKSASPLPGMHFPMGRFIATTRAIGLIAFAYNLRSGDQISGGPDWIKTELFDIDAKVEDSLVKSEEQKVPLGQWVDQVRPMVQSLLADRFKLKVSHTTKDLPVYLLVLAKNGPKFAEDNSHPEIAAISARGPGKLEATSVDFSIFARMLSMSPELGGRVVLDKTGLRGNYSFTLQWTPENLSGNAAESRDNAASLNSSSPSLFTALQEQLGLKLESAKSLQDAIVIDHIEQPTEN